MALLNDYEELSLSFNTYNDMFKKNKQDLNSFQDKFNIYFEYDSKT